MEELLDELVIDEPILPPGTPMRLREAQARVAGNAWRVYKNDADPFPSNPHAHNVANGLKLHLGNGDLYLGRQYTGKAIARKHLLQIREKLNRFSLPPLAE